jgi:hypothetical protein
MSVHHESGNRPGFVTTCERWIARDVATDSDWSEVTCKWCLRHRPTHDGGGTPPKESK